MGIFNTKRENIVKCGKCSTEFDLELNKEGCPLCGFGKNKETASSSSLQIPTSDMMKDICNTEHSNRNYLAIPPQIKSSQGKPILDDEAKFVGLWGMFNDYFSGKGLLRVCANMIYSGKEENVTLSNLVETVKEVIKQENLSSLKGFPNNIRNESSVNRLVYHFLVGFHRMGLFRVELKEPGKKDSIWNQDWDEILVRPTSEGLEFARLKNKVFDEKKYEDQTLTKEESDWLLNYLKKIDKDGFKEYTLLKEIVSFMKKGKTGKDLEKWFAKEKKFESYLRSWSAKTNNAKEFEEQISSLATTFSASKISLLRELGIIKNERNKFDVIGELR
jgi:ribosomal protein L37E